MKQIFLTHILSILVLSSLNTQASTFDTNALEDNDDSAAARPTSPPVDKNLLRVLEIHFLNKGDNSVKGAQAKALAQYKKLIKFANHESYQSKKFPQQH